MRWALVAAFVVFGAACFDASGGSPSAHPYAEAPRPWVVAHRGGMGRWPENTLYAFQRALEAGSDVLDMDIRTSADGALVVFHDALVDRTTDGRGRVDELRLDELRSLDAGYGWTPDGGDSHPFRGRGVVIPTLGEVFRALPHVPMGLEIKQRSPGVEEQLCRTIREARMQRRVLVASFDGDATRAFRAACPEVETGATFEEAVRFYLLTMTPPGTLLVPLRLGPLEIATPGFVRAAHRVNVPVETWVANDHEAMQVLLDAGVDGILTDYPERLIELRRGARCSAPAAPAS